MKEANKIVRLLGLRQASKELGVGYNKLLEAAHAGKLKCVRVGRFFRVTPDALNAFVRDLEEGKVSL